MTSQISTDSSGLALSTSKYGEAGGQTFHLIIALSSPHLLHQLQSLSIYVVPHPDHTMDALSSAASTVPVMSLTIQIADSVKKLCDFWTSVKEAPEDFHAIATDLELLSIVLANIVSEARHAEHHTTMTAALNACSIQVGILTKLISDIQSGLLSTRRRIRNWSALKAVMKSEKVKEFQDALERMKGTSLLARQNQQR
jgi:hypothetical protein